jgi:GNAT superfamily N-acetyltransferase
VIADLRPAQPTDAGAMGDILWRFQDHADWLPDLYTGAETIGFCGEMIDRGWVTVALVAGRVEGFLARDGSEIRALYLSAKVDGQGIGRQLLGDAKARSKRLTLRAFAANAGACRFYRREGFVETGRGDGADNDANLPEVHFLWPKEAAT